MDGEAGFLAETFHYPLSDGLIEHCSDFLAILPNQII